MDSCEELEVFERDLSRLDSKLMLQFALSSPLHTCHRLLQLNTSLARNAQGMRAACIRPHIRKGDLFGRTLLEEELILGIEEEDGEGAVEETFVDVGHEVAWAC